MIHQSQSMIQYDFDEERKQKATWYFSFYSNWFSKTFAFIMYGHLHLSSFYFHFLSVHQIGAISFVKQFGWEFDIKGKYFLSNFHSNDSNEFIFSMLNIVYAIEIPNESVLRKHQKIIIRHIRYIESTQMATNSYAYKYSLTKIIF